MITNVIFDLGNVLVECNPRNLYRKIFKSELDMEWFLYSVCTQVWNEQQDAGRPFAEGVAELIAQFPEFESEIRAFARIGG
jgi:2-haloacid dehalogenase